MTLPHTSSAIETLPYELSLVHENASLLDGEQVDFDYPEAVEQNLGQIAIPFELYRTFDVTNPDSEVASKEQEAKAVHYSELTDYFLNTIEAEGTPRTSPRALDKVVRELTGLRMSIDSIEQILLSMSEKGVLINRRSIERHMVFIRGVENIKQKSRSGQGYEITISDVKRARKSIVQRRGIRVMQRLAVAAHFRHVYQPELSDAEDKHVHDD